MPQNTNLNVTPYYDDFDKNKNFYKVLFRPGFPVQARELTTMQSILQNQVESMGTHFFKDGAMVIPGQVGYDTKVDCIQLQASFLGADVETYRTQLNGKLITGLNTGVKAKVLYSISAAESDKGYATLYIKYVESGGTEGTTDVFENNEQLQTDVDITFGTTLIEAGSAFAQLLPSGAISRGSAAYIEDGVYYIRGHFVDVPSQYILLDQYGSNPSYRIGLEVTESIITSEDDDSLNDNAAGTSNYSAPGAHRFKISTRLVKKTIDDDSDKNFIELLRINQSRIEKFVTRTAYNELEKSLALRTYETNGNYAIRNYQITVRDCLNDDLKPGINGVYEAGAVTSSGNIAGDNLYTAEISAGIAYVNGYQIETLQNQFVDFNKPRDTKALENQIIPFDVGNRVRLTNVFGFPNISGSSSVANSYQVVGLYDDFTASPYNTTNGNLIGYARALAIEHVGTGADTSYGTGDDFYDMNIFDIQMLSVIELSGTTTIAQGSQIVSANGATALIVDTQTSTNDIVVYQVRGDFRVGEEIFVDGVSKGTITNYFHYEFSDARSFACKDEGTQAVEFTGNLILDDFLSVEGDTFTYDSGAGTITGFNSNFAKDLRPGDQLFVNATDYLKVVNVDPTDLTTTGGGTTIFNYVTQVVKVTTGVGTINSGDFNTIVRVRAQLAGQENNDLFSKMPKNYVKSISDESMTVRRTYDAISVPAGSFTVDLGENEQFSAISDDAFQLTVLASTNGSYPAGSQIELLTDASQTLDLGYAYFTSADRTTLQVDNLTNITSVKLTASISRNVVSKKLKTLSKMFVLNVTKTIEDKDVQRYGLQYSNLYGTRIQDEEISLGVSDAFQLHAVLESLDDNDPVIPSLTIAEPTFFDPGSIITGKTSGAKAKVVSFNTGTLKLYYISVAGMFIAGETINGFDQNGNSIQGLINDDANAITPGSKVITDNYYLELNQTGFFYNTSKLVRKPGTSAPIRKIVVVYDWLMHQSTGDYFAGQSYSNIDYYNIPFYNQTQSLTDVLDFRPAAKNLYSGNGTVLSRAFVNCSTLDFKSRVFTTGATIFDIPKIGSDFRCDFDFYLPRIDKIFLSSDGQFQIVEGKSEEVPQEPDEIKNAMLLATMILKPYGFDPQKDVFMTTEDNRRYTMRDIGSLDRRLSSVEYYTALSLLEGETANTKILDASGKDRLKNGFVVDDFTSHDKSDTSHPDYRASLDFAAGTMRAAHYTTNIGLYIDENQSNDIRRTNQIVTLPYTEEMIIQQPYASRVVNVNPFNVFTYIGRIDLTPATDDWVETRREPANVTTIEGNFEATRREMNTDQNGFLPIQWNSWRTSWVGDGQVVRTETFRNSGWLAEDVGRSPAPWVWGGKGLRRVNERRVIQTTERQTRTGVRSRVVPRLDRQSLGDTLLSTSAIPWIRSRNVKMDVSRLKPRTRFYMFFDSNTFTQYMTPKLIEVVKDTALDSRSNGTPFVVGETVVGQTSGCRLKVAAPNDGYTFNPYDDTELDDAYSASTGFLNIDIDSMAAQVIGEFYGNIQVGEVLIGESGARAVVKDRRLISDRFGQLKACMFIPDPNVDTNPRWGTGRRTIRLTSNDKDSRIAGTVSSSAETTYTATGILNVVQENILAVRNAEIVRDTVTDERTIQSTREEIRQIGWYDPLAQSFIIDKNGGCYITSFDVYFYSKDSRIPISCQIRTMENGYPTKRILPFSDVSLLPTDVQISENASIPTRFTFQAPIFLQQSVEYCFVLLSDSNEYQVWVSRMGEIDVTGNRTISEQPYAGVLFKSQNASTWTADQYEDLKFTAYLAKFDITKNSRAVFYNSTLSLGNKGVLNLGNNPITTIKPDQKLVLNLANVPYTVGSRIASITGGNTYLGFGTVRSVQELATGTVVTVTDVTGVFALNNVITSSRSVAAIVTTGAHTFTAGNFIKNASGATAEITEWNAGSNTLSVRYVHATDDANIFADADTISEYSGIESTSVIGSDTISGAPTFTGDQVIGGVWQESTLAQEVSYELSQRKVTVRHSNHCMHDPRNNVRITGVVSEVDDTTLSNSISASDTTITVADASQFHTVINGYDISATNPGYIKLKAEQVGPAEADTVPIIDPGTFGDEEIISYSAINKTTNTITVLARAQDGTSAKSFSEGSIVQCYNLDGIPLTAINKVHNEIESPTLDSYVLSTGYVGTNGIVAGGFDATATQNVQFDLVAPSIANVVLPQTEMSARMQVISGTSIGDGNTALLDQESFVNDGTYIPIVLEKNNYFDSPKMVASALNESEELSGNKSLRMELTLRSSQEYLTPYIDLDRTSLITTMNRINSPASSLVATRFVGDTHDAAYITKIANLANKSGAIKLVFTAYRPEGTQIQALYRVRPVGSTESLEETDFTFFPGDTASIPGTTRNEQFLEYSYEVSGLKFDQYQIKIIMTSPNQSKVPVLQDFRAIALAI